MRFLLLLLLLIVLLLNGSSIDSEDDFPPFLRGIGWKNVEKELRKDMRLSSTLLPLSYEIYLNVSVRGYQGAERSTFDGFVLIDLNISSSINEIELHSLGLNIKKAQLMTTSSGSSMISDIVKTTYNLQKETVNFTLSETLQPSISAKLKIEYNGTAVMRGVGLYESWTNRGNDSNSRLPTISLVTNCSPTGARRWFPNFDEPDKKAKFRLRLQYPTELTAYSNTDGDTKFLENGRSETVFQQTFLLSTYIVAFALTEQSVIEAEHDGQRFRMIGGNQEKFDVIIAAHDYITSRPAFKNVTFIPEKTGIHRYWLIVHDFPFSAMENPGLITAKEDVDNSTILHEVAHMYFGNLVTHHSWEQVWLKEGFATFFSGGYLFPPLYSRYLASLYQPALHNEFTYSRTQFITGHFIWNSPIHYRKAGQLIALINRYLGEEIFDRALNRYLIDNSFGNGDSEMMINYLSEENPEARVILTDWIYQPGVALLSVEEEEGRVIIQQRRFLITDFDEQLRDMKTRWTIPLYFSIDGVEHMQIIPRNAEKNIINVPVNSNFSIDETYSLLYLVDYTNRTVEDKAIGNSTVEFPEVEKVDLSTFCTANASNSSREELWEMYLVQANALYLMCDSDLSSRENAMLFLRKLLISNELPVRNKHVSVIVEELGIMHPRILIDFLTEQHSNILFLDGGVCKTIGDSFVKEKDGMEKLREIVRTNPSFAANFYHMFTGAFEHEYIYKNNEASVPK